MASPPAPAGPRFVAYYRVSTDKQGRSGLGLDAQCEAVARHAAGCGGTVTAAFQGVESGRKGDRPQLALALAECRLRRAVLLIAKLDRLARDAHFLLGLEKAGVEFVAADMPYANRLTIGVMALVAEEEARATSARTKAALAAAKARGIRLGNPKLRPGDGATAADARAAWSASAARRAAEVLPYVEAARRAGAITLQELADALTARGVRTPRGGEGWRPWQVRRVLNRASQGDTRAPSSVTPAVRRRGEGKKQPSLMEETGQAIRYSLVHIAERNATITDAELAHRFSPALAAHPGGPFLAGDTLAALTLHAEGDLAVAWAPFDHVEPDARLVVVGITPGRHQAEVALGAFRDALAAGHPYAEALRRAKATAAFSGPMRANLVALLDGIGAARALGVASCAELFAPERGLAHLTSALRHPVFVSGENYNGAPDMLRTPTLRRMVETHLAKEARALPRALWIPLGPKPTAALRHLAATGVLDPDRILDGLPHPSGANAERIAYFLGRKARSALSAKTRADELDAARERLCQRVAQLTA